MVQPVSCFLQNSVDGYHRYGKMHWAKSSWFQPHCSFHGNTFALLWLYTVPLISNLTLTITRLNVALHVSYESRE